MNILIVTERFPYPPLRGDAVIAYNWIQHLAKRHNIFLISFIKDIRDNQVQFTSNVKNCCQDIQLVPNKNMYISKSTIVKNLVHPLPLSFKRYDWNSLWSVFLSFCRERKVDLAIFVGPNFAALADRITLIDLPAVIVPYDSVTLNLKRRIRRESNLIIKLGLINEYRKWRYVEANLLPKFEKCIVVSEVEKRAILKHWKGKTSQIEVIPIGIDTSYYKPMELEYEQESNSLIFSGCMETFQAEDAIMFFYKNVWPRVRKEVNDLVWYIVGKNPRKNIMKIAKREINVKVTGFVKDIRPYIARSTIYICPIRSGSGMKTRLLEAMAMGKAIVATSISCSGLKVRDNEHLLIADSPEEFANKIVMLLRNSGLRARLGHNARMVVEKQYSWEMVCEKVEVVLENLLWRKGKRN